MSCLIARLLCLLCLCSKWAGCVDLAEEPGGIGVGLQAGEAFGHASAEPQPARVTQAAAAAQAVLASPSKDAAQPAAHRALQGSQQASVALDMAKLGCAERFAAPAQHHVDPFGILEYTDMWPANSTARVKPRPFPVGPAYNSSHFDVFINTSFVMLNYVHFTSPTANGSWFPPGVANMIRTSFRPVCQVAYAESLLWTATYAYQLNAPPPLGRPDCQHPEITVPGYCANIIVYIPTSPTATWDEIVDMMGSLKIMPKVVKAANDEGMYPNIPSKYIKREVVKGSLGPVGRFGSPAPTATNTSTLTLFGAGLAEFADWQVEATKGALWDAYAEVAIFMEILHVQARARGPVKAAGQAVCKAEDACAPCGAVLAGPSVTLTFSYDYFEAAVLHSEFERYRPVLTEDFFGNLRSRGVGIDAVRIEPGSAVVTTDAGYMEATWASIAKLAAALVAMAVCTVCLVIGWRAQRRPVHAPDPWKLPPPRVSRSGSDASSTDEEGHGLLACRDISLSRRKDGSPWLLGCGGHGKVYRAVRKGVQDAAVKLLINVDTAQLAVFSREIQLLRRISFDRNIVQFYGACLESQPPMLVMEYMAGGDLFSALHSNSGGGGAAHLLSWWRRGRSVALDVARGLHFLHSEHVVHNDLKTKNILLSASYEVAKIGDVGLARIMDASHMTTGLAPCGTFAYAAPELLMGTRCDEKVDIYSFGVVLWELVCQERPLRGHLRAPRVPDECSEAVRALMEACIEAEAPALRPSAFEVFVRLANSPPTLEDAAAAAAAGAAAPEAALDAAGTPAPGAETLSGSGGLKTSQDPAPEPQLQAKVPAKPARPRSPGRVDSPAGAASSGEMLGQFKVGTPLQEVERAWNLGLPTGWGDSTSSGTGSGAAGHSRSSLVSDVSGLSASGSVLGPGVGAAAPYVLQSDSKGLRGGGGAQPDPPQPAGNPGAAGQAMPPDSKQVAHRNRRRDAKAQLTQFSMSSAGSGDPPPVPALPERSGPGGSGGAAGDKARDAESAAEDPSGGSPRSTDGAQGCGPTLAPAPGFAERGAPEVARMVAADEGPDPGAASSPPVQPAQAPGNAPRPPELSSTPRPKAQRGGPNPFA